MRHGRARKRHGTARASRSPHAQPGLRSDASSADLITEALHAITRRVAARVSVAVSMVEAAATN